AADDAHVFLYDGERLAFGVALWEDGRQQEPFAEPRPRGLTYTVARSGERIVAPDANSHPLFRDYQWGGAIVGLPLRIGERVVGVMNVAFERPHVFDESELRVLGLLADQAAIAIENARLYEETQQRALEQETLREAALALTTALNRNEVIDRILAQLQQVVPYDSASVQLLKGDRMEIVGGRGFPNLPDLLGISFPAHGDNPNSEVIRTQAPFIVDDAPAVYEDFSKEPFAAMGIRSWLGVPMLVGERLVGMIALDKCQPGFYTQEHARLAEAFAAQAAVAVENARLFEEEKRRATQLALINEVGEKAVSILDSDRLMQEVTRSIQASFNYYNVALLLLDEERGEVVMQAVTGGFEHLVPGEYRQSTDEGIIGFAARTGKSRLANDISKDPYYTKGFMGEVLTKSELCVPIKLGDKVIGALDVQSIHLNDFEQADVVAMEAVANRLAMGIQNARLYEEVAGLYDVGLAVSSALELDKTLRAIYEQVNRLMSPDTFYVALYDEARGELRFEIFIEEGQWLPKFTRKLDEGSLTAWIVQARESLFIGDIEKERESLPATPSQKGKPGTRSWMGFPLVARDKVVGVISVQSFRPHAFTEGNKRILSAFANQAAIAIENARLYEETKRRAEEMTALHETALDITAKLEMQHLLSAIITRASDLLGATGGLVHLYDPAREKLVAVTSHNLERDYTGLTLEVGEGVAGKVFQTGEALIIDDHCAWAGKSPQVEDAFARSMLGVPLRWREQVIGGLDIMDNERVGAFDEEDLGLLTLFANQAAIAIENAHLFEETERLKTFNENVVQGVAEAILIEDAQGVITFANPAAEELLGYTREELIGRRWTTIVPEEQVEKVRQETAKRPQGTVGRYETALLSKEGQVIPVIVSARPLFEEGKFAGILSAFIDIRERVRREREIEERRLYLEGVLGAAPDAIVTLDAHHRVVEWNAGAERLFGYSQEEVIGQNIDDLITGPDVLEEAVGFTQRVMGGGEVPPTETVRYRKDGSPVDVIVAGSPIMVGDELIGTVVVYTDITVRVRMEETLRALALLDELTSLYNRRGFFTLAEQQLKMADRTETKMLLLFADFDDLKWINDTLGHHEGDRALIEVANVLAETFRESDIIGRIGGDEFVVLAIETDGSPAEVLTARLQENLEARNARGDLRYRLSLSVGIAHYDPGHPCSIDELLAQADRSMYEKKQDNGVIASCSMSHSRHS
ncbi:MAG: GAF domain-containing protein, partial [Anaerolineae bacterium]